MRKFSRTRRNHRRRNPVFKIAIAALLGLSAVLFILFFPWNHSIPNTVSPPVSSSPSPALSAAPSATPSLSAVTQSPKPTQTAAPTPQKTAENQKPLKDIVIGIDPGHQAHANYEKEPVAPGSDILKAKVSSGTQGRWSKVPEHQVNLAVALLLRDLLEDAGATVIMTRETANVDISNAQRAQIFNKARVDLGIRLHCNGSEDASISGAFMLIPAKNPFLERCTNAAKLILGAYVKATKMTSLGIRARSDQTGFNWCERPIVNLEMGHMTNREDDAKLTDSAFQKKMAQGIYNGIVELFT